MKLIDMGGHQEYYGCSSLFISTSGVFLICFDSSLMQLLLNRCAKQSEDSREKMSLDQFCFGSIGTYIDLVCHTTAIARIRLKIALVATKTELSKGSPQKEDSFKKVLQHAKQHISLISNNDKVFLLNEVLRTSSAEATKENLTDYHIKLLTLCSHQDLKGDYEEVRPASWQMLLTFLHEHSMLSISSHH